jgi:capsular exopolysaccharide synthesis family protein
MDLENIITYTSPASVETESYKLLRTSLNFKNSRKKYRVIMLTSAGKKEGKTHTICNLAVAYAQDGKHVLLIDADLRMPNVNKLFGIDSRLPGLTNLLVDGLPSSFVKYKVAELDKLEIITAGNKRVSPSELLNSEEFEAIIKEFREEFDIILIDTPPILTYADANIVTKVSDGVILVVATNETRKSMLLEAKKNLDKVEAEVIGVVMTKAKFNKSAQYYSSKFKDKKKRKPFGKT